MAVSTSHSENVTSADPRWGEAWWWLGIPIAIAIALLVVHTYWPAFYLDHVLPEHTGLLENSHFAFPFIGLILCIRMLWKHNLGALPLLKIAVIIFAIACFYIAAEEESYGQHLFQWSSPEGWDKINRQNETNLHNTSYFLNQFPQTLLQIAIVIGGIILPIVRRFTGQLKPPIIDFLTPPAAIMPVGIIAMLFKQLDRFQKHGVIENEILMRPSEAAETFFALFILFYLIMLYRRTRLL